MCWAPAPRAPAIPPSPGGGKPCSSPVPQPPHWKETGPQADILLLPSKAALGTRLRIPSTRALGCILRNCLPSKIKGILNIPGAHFSLALPCPRCSTTPLTGAGSWRQGEPPGVEPDLIAIKAMPSEEQQGRDFSWEPCKDHRHKITFIKMLPLFQLTLLTSCSAYNEITLD